MFVPSETSTASKLRAKIRIFWKRTSADYWKTRLRLRFEISPKSKKFTGDDDFTYVINLLCLLVVRNPRARRSLASAKRQSAKLIGEMLVSDKRIWEHHSRKAREAGYVSGPDVSFDRVKAFVEGGKYTIEVATHALIRTELNILTMFFVA